MIIKRIFKKTQPEVVNDGSIKEAALIMQSGKQVVGYKKYLNLIAAEKALKGDIARGIIYPDVTIAELRKQIVAFDIDEGDMPVLDYIEVTQISNKQNFSPKFINSLLRQGFLSLIRGNIVLHANDKDYKFKILRSPGYFCCHDNEPLGSEIEAKQYVKDNFTGVESPDRNNLSGYRKDNFYACELINQIGEG